MAVGVDLGEYKVTFLDGTEPQLAQLTPWVLLECERKWPGRNVDLSDSMPRWEGLLFSMWIGLGRKGKFDDFAKRLAAIEYVGDSGVADATSVDPTKQVAGDD